MLNGVNKSIREQINILNHIIQKDKDLYSIIVYLSKLNVPNCYIGWGCITQSVWNYIYSCKVGYGISDVDIVYFDPDLSEEKERMTIKYITNNLPKTRYKIDIKNESRVHLWYENKFGFSINPYTSSEDAISTWPSTATSIGVKLENGNSLEVFAPYGMNDLFSGVIRPNKLLVSQEVYENKMIKWKSKWSQLTTIEW